MIILGGLVSKTLVFKKKNVYVVIVSNYNENPSNNWKLGDVSNKIFIAVLGENSLQNFEFWVPKCCPGENVPYASCYT